MSQDLRYICVHVRCHTFFIVFDDVFSSVFFGVFVGVFFDDISCAFTLLSLLSPLISQHSSSFDSGLVQSMLNESHISGKYSWPFPGFLGAALAKVTRTRKPTTTKVAFIIAK